MTAVPGPSAVSPSMTDRSILSWSTGNRRSQLSDEEPWPKSSIANRTPSWRRSRSRRSVSSGSSKAPRSGISRVSRCGSRPAPSMAAVTSWRIRGCRSWRLERFTAICTGRPARSASRRPCRQAWASTHGPMTSIRPASSARATKRSGVRSPSRGWSHRNSASKPATMPESIRTRGW